jgi:signal transduction histidine kinase
MKITTRIILGYGLFIAVLVALVVYQISTIERMRSINDTISKTNFRNTLAAMWEIRDLELIYEFTYKLFVSGDPDYLNQLREFQEIFADRLNELAGNAASKKEEDEIQSLKLLWDSFTVALERHQPPLLQGGTDMPQDLRDSLERLRTQTQSVYKASEGSMIQEVEKSRRTSETAALVLVWSTVAVLAISILVSFLIFRSISKPLAHLTEGTRAIAEGKFFYRLDTSRKDEFSQLAKDFNTMTHRLSELDELKKDFVSHVSHELKAPLASMKETIQIMLEEIPGPLTERQRRMLELNLQSGVRLTSMIANMLDLSKIEAGAMEYELKSRDLVPLVRNATAELEMQVREKQIQIKSSLPEGPLLVECDGDRIMQVIVNLVGNAVKFSPKKGVIEIRVKAIPKIPDSMPERWRRSIAVDGKEKYFGVVEVADSGPGVAESDREKIFEKFQQVKQEKKIAGQGVGLGLAICRNIVESHNGAIWVEDNSGAGSCFLLLLRPGKTTEETASHASESVHEMDS